MIVNIRYCQLSNRLAILAHAMATAIERGKTLRITVFDDLKDKYCCSVTWNGRVVVRASAFWAIEKKLWGAWRRLVGCVRVPGVISDWSYRDRPAVKNHRNEIVAFFTPKEDVIRYAQEFEAKYFCGDVVKIGVHVRRGDYATWKGGRYFYEDEVYLDEMRCLAADLDGRRIRFVLFSNDPKIEMLALKGHERGFDVVCSKGSPLDDHYLMSKCDYLFGPPSTFTLWASWMGKVPYAHISQKQHRPKLGDFRWNEEC